MLAKVKYPYRRRNQRLNAVLEISLPNHKGKTNNVSTTGVSFEVIADDIDAFRPGTIIPLEITTFNPPLSLLTTKVARASPSTSSEIIISGRPA